MQTPNFQNYINQNVIPQQVSKEQSEKAKNLMENSSSNRQNYPIVNVNPFETMPYQHIGIPDMPIQGTNSMTDVLLGDGDVPENIRKKYWFIFNKDNVLTFLDEERKRSKLLNFDIIRIDILNSMPYYEYNFDFEMDWDILKNSFETKLDRSLGFKGGNVKNERIILQSQFSEQRQISEIGHEGNVREGFFKRLLGRR